MSKSLERPFSSLNTPDILFVQPHGGLGNQLFMYFAGLYLARRNGIPLHLDFPCNHKSFQLHNGSIREFDLHATITLGSDLISLRAWDSFQSRLLAQDGFPDRLRRLLGSRLSHFHSFKLGFSSGLDFASGSRRVTGYFQTYEYFDQLTPGDKDLGFDKYEGSSLYKFYKTEIMNTTSVALHVRRGDYLSHKGSYGVLSRDYYKMAVSKLKKLTDVEKLFIFSDSEEVLKDIDWNFAGVQVEFVDPRKKLSAADNLRLMSFAKNHIIANSSFSWWGAKLSTSNGVVVAPQKWFLAGEQPKKLLPHVWVRSSSFWL